MRKRYMFTLEKENVEKYRELCLKAGLPAQTIGLAIDDFLKSMIPIMERATSIGQFTVVDFFTFLGEQVMETQNSMKGENESYERKIRKKTAVK